MAAISDPLPGLLKWLQGACVGALVSLRADAIPSPQCRPRVGKFGTYYAPAYASYMRACQEQFASALTPPPEGSRLAALVETIVVRPKTTKLTLPRGDVDNYAKAPLDAATKAGVWGDDGQIEVLVTTKRFAGPGESPGVFLHFGRMKP